MAVSKAAQVTETIAQQLVKRRENWVKTLDALPMPKAKVPEPPYPNMAAAVADGFALFDGGADGAWKILVKGWKTTGWRKAAEKNRIARDEAAEGELTPGLVKRVEKAAKAAGEGRT